MPQVDDVFPPLIGEGEPRDRRATCCSATRSATRIDAVLEFFPRLKGMMARKAGKLSGGERKMLAMGRVLMLSPSVLVLDEPTANLAPARRDPAARGVHPRLRQPRIDGPARRAARQGGAADLGLDARARRGPRRALRRTRTNSQNNPVFVESFLGGGAARPLAPWSTRSWRGPPPVSGLDRHRRDALVIILTLVTGSTDAIGLIRLGGVFTSVMTGNMVLLGLAVGEKSGSIALHTGVAFVLYIIGSFFGARVAGHAPPDESHPWPRTIVWALTLELAVFALFALWWELVHGAPSSNVTYALLGLNAMALGVQSAAVLRFGIHGLSTTYLTGTLTQFVAGFTKRDEPIQVRSGLILLMLIAGAALGAFLAVDHPLLAPIVPVGALVVVVVGAWTSFHRSMG